jgi:site-specific DNA-methyltransferase (adenine-specific)
LSDDASDKQTASEPPSRTAPRKDTRAAVAGEAKVPERKLRAFGQIEKSMELAAGKPAADRVVRDVISGKKSIAQARREAQAAAREARRRAELERRAAFVGPPGNGRPRLWEVREGDCLEVLGAMPVGSARQVFADPPYNQDVPYGDGFDDARDPAEYLRWSRAWIEAAARALTPDGSLWILISYEWVARLQIAAEDAGLHLRQWLTWYEAFGQNQAEKFNRCTRPLLWLVKDPDRFVFNDAAEEIRRPSARLAIYRDARAVPDGKLLDDLWVFSRVAGTHDERLKTPDGQSAAPTQLPIGLLRAIVACASEPGDLVVDPFSGSGTTGAACIELGRHYVGIERNSYFVELSRQRLIAHESEPGPVTSDHTG